MATGKGEARGPLVDTVDAAGTQLKIKWDDSNMRSVYANVCNVAGTREEFVLLFGMNQSWNPNQKELTVQLSDRVVMNPFAAKRLAQLLSGVIRDYEARHGVLDLESRRPPETVS